jgi:hypothetical protein
MVHVMRATVLALSVFVLAACGDGKPAETPKGDVTPAPIDAGTGGADGASSASTSDTAAPATPPPREERCIAGKFVAGKGCVAEKSYEANAAVDKAAESAFNAINADMTKSFAQETKKDCPAKTVKDLFGDTKPGQSSTGKWKELVEKGTHYAEQLDGIAKTYHSGFWAAVAFARIGLMWSHLRAQMDACTAQNVALFTPEQQKTLDKLEKSGRQEMIDQANDIKKTVPDLFNHKKTAEEGAAEELAIRRLALSVATANAYGVLHPLLDGAKTELAQLRTAIGDERMKAYLSGAGDPFDPDRKRTLADLTLSP